MVAKTKRKNDDDPFAIQILLDGISDIRESKFDETLSAEELGPFADERDEYQLEDREVDIVEDKCPAGHIHRIIILKETFNKESGVPKVPTYNIDAAFAMATNKVKEIPPEAVEPLGQLVLGVTAAAPELNKVFRILQVKQDFHTKESLKMEKDAEKVQAVIDKQKNPGLN